MINEKTIGIRKKKKLKFFFKILGTSGIDSVILWLNPKTLGELKRACRIHVAMLENTREDIIVISYCYLLDTTT